MMRLETIYRGIEGDLAAVRRRTAEVCAEAGALVGARASFEEARGGKALRPAVLLLVSRLFHADRDAAVRLAAIVELVHAASLIHDDVLDQAPTRRGKPTTASIVGASDAVLLGDVIFTGAFRAVADCGVPGAVAEIARASQEVCAGEVLQNLAKGTFATTRRQYLRIIDYKTASLYRAAAALGALSGGAGAKEAAAAGRFGRLMGLAFQVADDLLDVAGDAARTGKPTGRDLAEGNMTLPMIMYLDGIPPARRREARAALAAGDARALARALGAMAAPRRVAAVRKAAQGYCREAAAELERLPDGRERKSLARLCEFAANRAY